jgi:putative membrane protein
MALLNENELQQVSDAVARIERSTDAEVVTVLAAQADDYTYIPLLWAALIALLVPGIVNYHAGWLGQRDLLLTQWGSFAVLAFLFRVPAIMTRLVPRSVRHWRAANLARRQFLEQNLHHTAGDTGVLIFVSEAERYVEILVDRGIGSRVDDAIWQPMIEVFTAQVRRGQTLQGFLACIDSVGGVLAHHVPVTHTRNELPDRLVVLR